MATLLADALELVAQTHWANTRSEQSSRSQGEKSISDIKRVIKVTNVEEVTQKHLLALVALWTRQGYAKATIEKRLTVLGMMGIEVKGCRPRGRGPLKWWLNPADKRRTLEYLLGGDPEAYDYEPRRILADYIEWTCHTGLRVEETLRLKWRHVLFTPDFTPRGMSVNVPGTKTSSSEALLPLGENAAVVLLKRRQEAPNASPNDLVFDAPYWRLKNIWNECRTKLLGADEESTATLRSLRRSAARYLHVDRGMPLDVTRQYLRHTDVQTTMGYLKLVGGYGVDEMRRFL